MNGWQDAGPDLAMVGADVDLRELHGGFCRRLREDGAPGFLFEPVSACPDSLDIANALHVVMRARRTSEWVHSLSGALADGPTDEGLDLQDFESLASDAVEVFSLNRVGMLRNLIDYPDDDLTAVTLSRVYETLLSLVRGAYRGYRTIDPTDVAHQLLVENLDSWADGYDPRRGSLRTYVAYRVRPGGIGKVGRISTGLERDVPLVHVFRDENLDDHVATFVDSERAVRELPDEVRLYSEGYSYAQISRLLNIKQVAARVRVHRYIQRQRLARGVQLKDGSNEL